MSDSKCKLKIQSFGSNNIKKERPELIVNFS